MAANRLGDDLFANCLIALNAETGERIWHFQGVRHDIWDRDFPSPPTLVTVQRDGKEVDAVAQTTKQGFVYLFDRSNGQTLFPIEYRKYPAEQRAGRNRCRGAASAHETSALCAPAAHRRSADQSHSRSPSLGGRAIPQVPQRRSIRSAQCGQGHGCISRLRRRRRVGRVRRGSRDRNPLRKRERNGVDGSAGGKHRQRIQRPRNLPEPMQRLPWRQHGRLPAAVPRPDRHRRPDEPEGNCQPLSPRAKAECRRSPI